MYMVLLIYKHLDIFWFSIVKLWPLGNFEATQVLQSSTWVFIYINSWYSGCSWYWSSWELQCSICIMTRKSSRYKRGSMLSKGISGEYFKILFHTRSYLHCSDIVYMTPLGWLYHCCHCSGEQCDSWDLCFKFWSFKFINHCIHILRLSVL